MRIVIAPDSFKGSLSAVEVADIMEKGLKRALPDVETIKFPVADGGEGTVEAWLRACGGERRINKVHGPRMEERNASWGIIKKADGSRIGIIEMAESSGLMLIPSLMRTPMKTTTYGVGELIDKAIREGCKKILIGLGGSATNDGGIGMAQALGVEFFLGNGDLLPLGEGASRLKEITRIEIGELRDRLKNVAFVALCDVENPMTGEKGATRVFSPQKGASPEEVESLEDGMLAYRNLLEKTFGYDIGGVPGSGAAGGLGAGVMAFLGAELKPGVKTLIQEAGFKDILKCADVLVVGEGCTDGQTAFGKAPMGLAKEAKKQDIPVICLSGALGDGYEALYSEGVNDIRCCIDHPMELKEAMDQAAELLEKAAFRLGKALEAMSR